MRKIVKNIYTTLYSNQNYITFTEMLLVCLATIGIIFGTLFIILSHI